MSSDCSIYGPALVPLWLSVAHTLGVLSRAEIIAAVCPPVWRCPWLWGVDTPPPQEASATMAMETVLCVNSADFSS